MFKTLNNIKSTFAKENKTFQPTFITFYYEPPTTPEGPRLCSGRDNALKFICILAQVWLLLLLMVQM